MAGAVDLLAMIVSKTQIVVMASDSDDAVSWLRLGAWSLRVRHTLRP
jgi:hypothetical protein